MSLGELWPQTGMRALYHLSDTSDASGNTATLTNNNSVGFVAGELNNAADFGTANTNKSLTRASNIWSANQIANLSIGGLFKVRTEPGSGVYYVFWDTSTSLTSNSATNMGGWLTYGNTAGTKDLSVRFAMTGGSGSDSTSYTVNLGTAISHFIVVTVSSGVLKLYLDGLLVGTATYTGGSQRTAGDTISVLNGIGRYHDSGGAQWSSIYADETFFIERTMSDVEIRRRYALIKGKLY